MAGQFLTEKQSKVALAAQLCFEAAEVAVPGGGVRVAGEARAAAT